MYMWKERYRAKCDGTFWAARKAIALQEKQRECPPLLSTLICFHSINLFLTPAADWLQKFLQLLTDNLSLIQLLTDKWQPKFTPWSYWLKPKFTPATDWQPKLTTAFYWKPKFTPVAHQQAYFTLEKVHSEIL